MADEHKPEHPLKKQSRFARRLAKRSEREEIIAQQRNRWNRRERNKKIFNYTILAVILALATYGVYVYAVEPKQPGKYDAFAKCLTQRGVIMYGTEWCSHCQSQKRLFGNSFRYVTFINCDLNADACSIAGADSYPTWVFPQGPLAQGEQQLATLAERTGCALQ